jgi:DNA-binding HxlR family transcriptional regulator
MTETASYGQFCPVSMAAEILCARWTIVLLREMLCGSTRFNDLRRGLPRMSPTLLSKRLKELELAGVIRSVPTPAGTSEYHLTEAGEELRPIIIGIGTWGQRWVESRLSLRNLDPTLLMWDMRRNLSTDPLPPRRCTIQFLYPELAPTHRNYWLVVESGDVDLCQTDPGFEVDLLVTSSLRTMTSIWMGLARLDAEVRAGRVQLDGDPAIGRAMQQWLKLSVFAQVERRVA